MGSLTLVRSLLAEVSLLLFLGSHSAMARQLPVLTLLVLLVVGPPFLPQVVFQGGHHVPNQFLCPFQPTQWGPWYSLELVHLVVQVPNFFPASLGCHCLDGRDICLWVQAWETMSVALGDHVFCLLSPQMGCLEEHLLKNKGVMLPPASQCGHSSRNISTSICHSISWMDRPSLLTQSLAVRVFCLLSWYDNSSNPW